MFAVILVFILRESVGHSVNPTSRRSVLYMRCVNAGAVQGSHQQEVWRVVHHRQRQQPLTVWLTNSMPLSAPRNRRGCVASSVAVCWTS